MEPSGGIATIKPDKKHGKTRRNKKKIEEGIKMFTMMQAVLQNRKGQGMVEYGLILALIAVVVIGTLTNMGTDIVALFTKASVGLK